MVVFLVMELTLILTTRVDGEPIPKPILQQEHHGAILEDPVVTIQADQILDLLIAALLILHSSTAVRGLQIGVEGIAISPAVAVAEAAAP